VSIPALRAMVEGESLRAMQCHATPDSHPRICVGFARRAPDALGTRLAILLGGHDPTQVDVENPPRAGLHTLRSLTLKHGTMRPCPRDDATD